MNRLLLLPWLALVACDSDDEGGGTDESDTNTNTDTDTDTDTPTTTPYAGEIDSCVWPDVGVCYEYVLYEQTEQWCADISDLYGFETVYADAPCPSGEVGTCELSAGGDLDHATTAYYYAPTFEDDPVQACEDAGGTPG